MLYRPKFVLAAARQRLHFFTALRTLTTGPYDERSSDPHRLNRLLNVETTTAPLWGGGHANVTPFPQHDPQLENPPKAPDGSLPPRSPPAPSERTKKSLWAHSLPAERHFHLHVFASRNNTILTLTRQNYTPLAWVSAGMCGFKKVQRSGYEAGYQCAVRMFARIAREKATSPSMFRLDIAFSGFGFGREAVFRALMASEGDGIRDSVRELKDTTPLKVGGGIRAKKARRL